MMLYHERLLVANRSTMRSWSWRRCIAGEWWSLVVIGAVVCAAPTRAEAPPEPTADQSDAVASHGDGISEEHRRFWSFQPVTRLPLPQVNRSGWPRSPIDRYVLARLEANHLAPVGNADKRTLIRRVTFDLIGLPPDPEEVELFVADDSPVALARLVDRLLASPHYGERWARHWLDVARYGEDQRPKNFKYEPMLHAFRYRDWVIRAFNEDLPYDQFVVQQIAGDLIKGSDDHGGVIAVGYFALGPTYGSDGDNPDSVARAKAETLEDRIDVLSRGFLGLTVACARCHDHKFDPIPTQDFYSLAGVFQNIKYVESANPAAHSLADSGSEDMKVAIRGDLRNPGEVAPRRFLRIISGDDAPRFTKGSGRLELAQAIASPDNPLTARVMVNRIWQHHFGRGIVATPSNFGALGERPTHPLLLDWLADRFVHSGWAIKQLHREITLSATYGLSSDFNEHHFRVDGDNKLLWRMNRQRLEIEPWRDALLAVSGRLDKKMGGPPDDPLRTALKEELPSLRKHPKPEDNFPLATNRRTIYTPISRGGRFASDDVLRLFDFPDPRTSNGKRNVTTVPQQHLFTLNSEFMIQQARQFAQRFLTEQEDDRVRLGRAFSLALGRPPTAAEQELALEFLHAPERQTNRLGLSRWEQYAQVLLGSNEFMYVP